MSITIIIIAITVLISFAAFSNASLSDKLILYPRQMNSPEEYYRFLTSGFIHGDWNHLFFNMYTLYMFGELTEQFIGNPIIYVVLYLSGVIVSSIYPFIKNRNNSYYKALGASGGVSSVIFFVIYYFPWSKMSIIFIPIGIPAIIFAALYLTYSIIMSKRGADNIGHDAHIGGALYGMFFAFLIDPTHGVGFINTVLHPY
ncbi:MAG: rhomboid family intrarane serine protease [Flavipsychrobacter sp.]|nr:rhomboid family intrarane serine protease [Flavipsychrobacter sp.]